MEENIFVWNDELNKLQYIKSAKAEDEHEKRQKQQSEAICASVLYCPHSYLIPRFKDTLSPSQKLKFQKQQLRRASANKLNIISLQDVKDLVIHLLATPVNLQFIKFFHLPIIDNFLRILIFYFQYYTHVWQELIHERATTAKNVPYHLSKVKKDRYAKELKILRSVLARQYADIIMGCQGGKYYHHMMNGNGKTITITQSQGEKDLRLFETLIAMAHRVVWITLQRKYFHIIEIELDRLLRTNNYNIAQRQNDVAIMKNILENNTETLHGPKIWPLKKKLLTNSPLVEELLYGEYDHRMFLIGIKYMDTDDPYITYLQNLLLAREDEFASLNIEIGILGQNRSNFDVMLMPCETANGKKPKGKNAS